jgi:hypothetical protein
MDLTWKPKYYDKTSFSIDLDGEFAEQAYDLDADRDKMNDLGNRILEDYSQMWRNPYRFGEGGVLVTSIHLGDNGTWIATKDSSDDEKLTYESHNVDTTEQAVALQHLFGKWVETTETLLEGER